MGSFSLQGNGYQISPPIDPERTNTNRDLFSAPAFLILFRCSQIMLLFEEPNYLTM